MSPGRLLADFHATTAKLAAGLGGRGAAFTGASWRLDVLRYLAARPVIEEGS
ncbi:hypothetical protein Lesp02_31890 [Lentzea sp. NBRC 105346]|uniref:hypothetical protein n=1 Tax=Lentzea sp. NBRC 105346 TaxID=3032205 RepID=UPI0024A3BF61|nr:hypothetical protein [Lentzea sp. NBRC 105346]GLZ31000.1 hypothetical protein Lesp02_31890 [Lentzea sp. NBRC 105346]